MRCTLSVGVHKIVTHRLSFSDAQQALELSSDATSGCVKAMLYPDDRVSTSAGTPAEGQAGLASLVPGIGPEDVSAADVAASRTPLSLAASLD